MRAIIEQRSYYNLTVTTLWRHQGHIKITLLS